MRRGWHGRCGNVDGFLQGIFHGAGFVAGVDSCSLDDPKLPGIHSFPVIRDDFGLELSASNNDCAKLSIELNFENLCYIQNHPNDSLDEARKVKELGEAE